MQQADLGRVRRGVEEGSIQRVLEIVLFHTKTVPIRYIYIFKLKRSTWLVKKII